MSKSFRKGRCPFCSRIKILSPHHVFGGTKSMRRFSEKHNAIEWVCWECHTTNEDSIHRNSKLRNALKIKHQERIMKEQSWNLDRWMEEVRENYLKEV